MNAPESKESLVKARIKRRSLFCRIILSAAMTYFLILALLFLAGTIFSQNIIRILGSYQGTDSYDLVHFRWFVLTGSFLYFTAVSGIILFMLKRKAGFYIFITAALVILALDFTFLNFDWLRYLIHSGFIFLLGIAHFSKRCYL